MVTEMEIMSNKLKMYIFVRKSLTSHKVVGVAHGVLMAHLKFVGNSDYNKWLNTSFNKVICEVTEDEFHLLKNYKDFVTVTESTLDDKEIALVFCPREHWPAIFKQFPLLKI